VLTNRLPLASNEKASPFVVDFLRALQAAGVEPSVFTPLIGEDDGSLGMPVYRFDWGERNRTLSELNLLRPANWTRIRDYFNRGTAALREHLQGHNYDHLLALWALPAGWFAHRAARDFKIPYSIWTLGSDINVWARRPVAGSMIRRALRHADHLFADGDELSEKVSRLCGRDCHFLPSLRWLDYRPGGIRREKLFLYLGRLERSKGIYDLLRAFAMIRQDIWDYRLIYLGTGSQEARLIQNIKWLRLRGKVHVLGWVTLDEVIHYLQRARALVIPTHSDSIPLVFGEALQTATPMIVTEVGDLGTLVRDNRLGIAVHKKSVTGLHDAMVKMMTSDFDIRDCARRVLEKMTPERAAARFLEVANAH
jgi:glycosyltransferase involved in cell wall biosynthesis